MTADDFIFADYAEYMVPPKQTKNGQPLCDLDLCKIYEKMVPEKHGAHYFLL